MPISRSIRITAYSIYVQLNSWGRPDWVWARVGGEWVRALESLSHVIHVLL